MPNPVDPPRVDTASLDVSATPTAVFAAFEDGDELMQWLPPEGLPMRRSAAIPTSPKGRSGTSTRARVRRGVGIASSATRACASMATALASQVAQGR